MAEQRKSRDREELEADARESREEPAARLPVSEFAAERPGPLSPFGEDVEFPLPPDQVTYVHPTAADKPNLAGDPYNWS
jgi:hypothetical protein